MPLPLSGWQRGQTLAPSLCHLSQLQVFLKNNIIKNVSLKKVIHVPPLPPIKSLATSSFLAGGGPRAQVGARMGVGRYHFTQFESFRPRRHFAISLPFSLGVTGGGEGMPWVGEAIIAHPSDTPADVSAHPPGLRPALPVLVTPLSSPHGVHFPKPPTRAAVVDGEGRSLP